MRTGYDAINSKAYNIPLNAEVVFYYVDGLYKWSAMDLNRFPHAKMISIAVFSTTVAHVLDVEVGNDMTPSHWVSWVNLCREHGIDKPCIYTGLSNWQNVKKAFSGETEPLYWIADWTNIPHLIPGTVATQYSNPGPYDISQVIDVWPGVDSDPILSTIKETDMPYLITVSPGPVTGNSTGDIFIVDAGRVTHIPSIDDATALTNRFGNPIHVNTPFFQRLIGVI